MLRAIVFVLVAAGVAMAGRPAWAQAMPDVESPQMMYRIGAANEAALRCRDLRMLDKVLQNRAYLDAKSNSMSSKAMSMGTEDFAKEFSAAYKNGREQLVCDKYLRRYPSLLTRR
jgi:hypothetical protein